MVNSTLEMHVNIKLSKEDGIEGIWVSTISTYQYINANKEKKCQQSNEELVD